MWIVWLVMVFILGAAIGSFLNVCIARLPLEKSLIWPGSRCGNCLKPIRWQDNIPLLSYWLLRGRCRMCGATFSMRYFFVELLTALGFAGLFWAEIVENIHQFQVLRAAAPLIQVGVIPWQGWVIFGHHALLFCFLLVAAFCDLAERSIPLSVTVWGMLIGLVSSVLWPWPWPDTLTPLGAKVLATQPWWLVAPRDVLEGLYPWPVWGPLPFGLEPGHWLTGLATGVAGALVGTFMLRGVRFLFGTGIGMEALGLGDADLMMMAGAFLGWQPVVVAFFVAVFPALLFGLIHLVRAGENMIPFGPSLALGIMITWLGWPWIGPAMQLMFFNDTLMVLVVIVGAVFMFISSFVIRLTRAMRGV